MDGDVYDKDDKLQDIEASPSQSKLVKKEASKGNAAKGKFDFKWYGCKDKVELSKL